MMSIFPYGPMQFDGLALFVWNSQKPAVEQLFAERQGQGRWDAHPGGVTRYVDGNDGRDDSRIEIWTFYAADREHAEWAQRLLDAEP